MKSLAQQAYELELRAKPFYSRGDRRKAWHELSPIAQESWARNPWPRWSSAPHMDAHTLWLQADFAWSHELHAAFGNDAGNQRYKIAGQGEPFNALWVAHLAWHYFGNCWTRERALDRTD